MGPDYNPYYEPVANYGYSLADDGGGSLITKWTPFSGDGDGSGPPASNGSSSWSGEGVGMGRLALGAVLGGIIAGIVSGVVSGALMMRE